MHAGEWKKVSGSTLMRVVEHINSDEGFVLMSAWKAYIENDDKRGDRATVEKINEQNTQRLKADIRSKGYGFIPLRGHYQHTVDECEFCKMSVPAGTYSRSWNCPACGHNTVGKIGVEPSFLIPGMGLADGEELMLKYEQETIVYSGPDLPEFDGINKPVVLVNKKGVEKYLGNKWSSSVMSEAWSELTSNWRKPDKKNRKFEFHNRPSMVAGLAETPMSMLSARQYELSTYGKKFYSHAGMSRALFEAASALEAAAKDFD
jgi:hypothetical protein